MDTKTTLLAALPLVLIITALAAVIVFSNNPSFKLDIRPKAAAPVPTLEPVNPYTTPTQGLNTGSTQLQPETVCSDLYAPVCGNDGLTYESACDAQRNHITIAYYSACYTTSSSYPALPEGNPAISQ